MHGLVSSATTCYYLRRTQWRSKRYCHFEGKSFSHHLAFISTSQTPFPTFWWTILAVRFSIHASEIRWINSVPPFLGVIRNPVSIILDNLRKHGWRDATSCCRSADQSSGFEGEHLCRFLCALQEIVCFP